MSDFDKSPYGKMSDFDKFLSAFDKRFTFCCVYFCSKQ